MKHHIKSFTDGFNSWLRKRFPKPGAENYAYQTLMLPYLSVYGNINYRTLGELIIITEPFTLQQQVVPTGLAGIVAGQLISQPLILNPATPQQTG